MSFMYLIICHAEKVYVKHNVSARIIMYGLHDIFYCSPNYCTNSFSKLGTNRGKLPPGVVYASRVLVGINKGALFLGVFAKMERWSHKQENSQGQKTRIDRIVCQTKVSASSWESPIKENLGLDARYVLSGICSWDRRTCYKETSWGVSQEFSSVFFLMLVFRRITHGCVKQ